MHLAQFNIARALWPLDDPRMAGFSDNVDLIHRIAHQTPGFLWLMDDDAPEKPTFPGDPLMTFTLSMWEDEESLRFFTWNTLHKKFRLRTREWFEPLGAAYLVCWPIEEGRRPDGAEAIGKLDQLRREGPSDALFGVERLSAAQTV